MLLPPAKLLVRDLVFFLAGVGVAVLLLGCDPTMGPDPPEVWTVALFQDGPYDGWELRLRGAPEQVEMPLPPCVYRRTGSIDENRRDHPRAVYAFERWGRLDSTESGWVVTLPDGGSIPPGSTN